MQAILQVQVEAAAQLLLVVVHLVAEMQVPVALVQQLTLQVLL